MSRNLARRIAAPAELNRNCTLPKAASARSHHVVDLRARGDVDLERQRLAAFAVDRGGGVARAGFVDVGADDVGAFAREDQRRGAADAACRRR